MNMFLIIGVYEGLGLIFDLCLFSRVQFKNMFPHNDELNVFEFFKKNDNTKKKNQTLYVKEG